MANISAKVEFPVERLKKFCEQHDIKELSLFGSAVSENFNEESDIDLLVEFKPEARVGFIELSKMQRELSLVFKRPVDLVSKNGLKPKIRDSIISSAEMLYAS